MNIAKILYGLAQLFVFLTVISIVYSKYRNGRESKIQKYSYVFGFLTFLVIIGSVVVAQIKNTESLDVMAIARESNIQLKTPRDMGNGFRMEPIVGYGNVLKFSFTFSSSVQREIDQVTKNLKSNDMIKSTCNSNDAKTYLEKGIELEYLYIDYKGNEIVTYRIKPSDCNFT